MDCFQMAMPCRGSSKALARVRERVGDVPCDSGRSPSSSLSELARRIHDPWYGTRSDVRPYMAMRVCSWYPSGRWRYPAKIYEAMASGLRLFQPPLGRRLPLENDEESFEGEDEAFGTQWLNIAG